MRGKGIAKFLLVVLGTAMLTTSCQGGGGKAELAKNKKEIKTEIENIMVEPPLQETEEAPLQTEEEKMTVFLNESFETILTGCSKELIGGYVVDEAFLSWFTRNFGKESLGGLCEAIKQGQTDARIWDQLAGYSIHVLWSMFCRDIGFQSYRLENVFWQECASKEKIVLNFTGDINFAEEWSTTVFMDQQPNGLNDCLSPALLNEMKQADIMMVNNEFTYSTKGEPLPEKDFTFRAHPDRVWQMDLMSVDIVSLANNHTYDYGEEALLDTLATLETANIPYVGAGRDLSEAMKPSYFIANGKKIAIVSATQVERTLNYTKEATADAPGVLKTLNPDKFITVIEEAKRNADFVVVYVHWGTEGTNHFENDQRKLSRAYIKAGASAIIGAHPHCLQGIEFYQGVPIIYSLGNFWFSGQTIDTGISQLILNQDGTIDFRFLPCIQEKHRTYLVEEAGEKQRIWDFMTSISDGIVIDKDGYAAPIKNEIKGE